MNNISKPTRELYSNIRSELVGLYYRLILIRQLFTSKETNDFLNQAAIRFFTTLKWDLLDTIAIAVGRLTDSAKSFNKYNNCCLQQLIDSLDSSNQDLISSLNNTLSQIKAKSSRIKNWRKKWAAHRDFDIVQGSASMPAISLKEIDDVLSLIGKFLNEFERIYQDRNSEIDLYNNPMAFKKFEETERLKIYPPNPYENMVFQDDGNTIIELIKQAKSLGSF